MITLKEKYNQCLALNYELEEIIEMQSKEMVKMHQEIKELKEELRKGNKSELVE